MFEIIESLCEPIRFLKAKNANLKIGNIIQIIEEDDCPKVDICHNKNIPFGIVVKIDNFIHVAFETMIFRTNIIEKTDYIAGDFLYCSENGKLTKFKTKEDAIILGSVINGLGYGRPWIEVNWV